MTIDTAFTLHVHGKEFAPHIRKSISHFLLVYRTIASIPLVTEKEGTAVVLVSVSFLVDPGIAPLCELFLEQVVVVSLVQFLEAIEIDGVRCMSQRNEAQVSWRSSSQYQAQARIRSITLHSIFSSSLSRVELLLFQCKTCGLQFR